mmetsp:Transcript_6531/g.8487  ORF Transcript_6531/g.8487 Transcript_6531/m.8487 type:complete len:444 (+) Transcript_6531:130-1461(+)
MSSSSSNKKVFWKVGSPVPDELANCADPFSSALVPQMIAWLSVDDERVTLLEGFSGGSYTPPSLFFSASAIPADFLETLKRTKVCTISSATVRDPPSSFQKAHSWPKPTSHTFAELGLLSSKTKQEYPKVVASSPIHMHCSLENFVELGEGEEEALVVLVVESFVISGSILSPPTEEMKKRPNVVAKIDAKLINPVVSLGGGRTCPLKEIHSMPRPVKSEDGNSWTSTDFDLACPTLGPGNFGSVEWNFREHGASSPLGYNAVTALIMPRPIGWISTYHATEENEKLAHLAPYSFFCNVSRSAQRPMVAFSGYRKDDGTTPKDAQNDAEQSKCFTYNMVNQSLAVPMNLSAAELPREGSEFALAGLDVKDATLIRSPIVENSPIRFECQYMKSVPIGSFSIVVGQVLGVGVDQDILTDQNIDPAKLNAITRMGFMDEYGTLDV